MKKYKINYWALISWLLVLSLVISNFFIEITHFVFSLFLSFGILLQYLIDTNDYYWHKNKIDKSVFGTIDKVLILSISVFILTNRFFNIQPDLRFDMTFTESFGNALLIFLCCLVLPSITFYFFRILLFDKKLVFLKRENKKNNTSEDTDFSDLEFEPDSIVNKINQEMGYRDALFEDAARIVVKHQLGSTSLIQRQLKLGYNRSGRLIDQLEAYNIVGPFEGSKPRQVLIPDESALEKLLNDLNFEK